MEYANPFGLPSEELELPGEKEYEPIWTTPSSEESGITFVTVTDEQWATYEFERDAVNEGWLEVWYGDQESLD